MAELRYVGTSNWERAVVNEKGEFVKSVRTPPGSVVEFDDEGAEKVLSRPRFIRSFVAVNGPEDTYGDSYVGSRYDVQGNATPYPELDMGSTVQPGRSISADPDNEDGLLVAGPHEGPNSDNEDTRLRNEAREVGAKAEREAREKLAKERANAKPSGKATQQSHSQQRSSSAEGAQKSGE
jgi:hypothetical protein